MKNIALVVEDEQVVRTFVSESLKILGYDVVEADTEEKAWAMYQENKSDLSYIFTDIHLSTGNGVSLYKRIREVDTSTLVTLSSGYSDGNIEGIMNDNRAEFLPKPFTWEDLKNYTQAGSSRKEACGAA